MEQLILEQLVKLSNQIGETKAELKAEMQNGFRIQKEEILKEMDRRFDEQEKRFDEKLAKQEKMFDEKLTNQKEDILVEMDKKFEKNAEETAEVIKDLALYVEKKDNEIREMIR